MVNGDWKQGFLLGTVGGALVVGVVASLLMGGGADGVDRVADSGAAEGQQRVMEVLQADLTQGLDRWYSGDPFGYAELYAQELSYFDPGTAVSLSGVGALRTYYEPLVDLFHIDRHETVNLRLQLHGDFAILTFNLNEYEAGDTPTAEWKVTHVYRQFGEEWRVIHGHFSEVAAE